MANQGLTLKKMNALKDGVLMNKKKKITLSWEKCATLSALKI